MRRNPQAGNRVTRKNRQERIPAGAFRARGFQGNFGYMKWRHLGELAPRLQKNIGAHAMRPYTQDGYELSLNQRVPLSLNSTL